MKKLIQIGIILIIILMLCGCTGTTALLGSERGTIVSVYIKEGSMFDGEQVVVELGNGSKGIFRFTRYDTDGIDWYEYLNSIVGEYVQINWSANSKESHIRSIEILDG